MTSTNTLNNYVTPLLNDKYQYTMAYAYFKNGHHLDHSVFEVFFRKNPFGGEYTILAGILDVLEFVRNFKISEDEIEYLKKDLRIDDPEFFNFLRSMNMDPVKIYGVEEGTLVFPRTPVIQVEGPVIHCQLLETTMLTLVNYASLVTTNAARFRMAAGYDKLLLEFGLRRAQGPDGGMSASRYTYMGGFDGTSNLLAGKTYNIPCMGTHAHSFVTSYTHLSELNFTEFEGENIVEFCKNILKENGWETNEGELTSFIAYAYAFPKSFLALVDTYDVIASGLPNFLAVAYFLHKHGYKPLGIRIDSGDLSYLSKVTREMYKKFDEKYQCGFSTLGITASNDINEEVLISLDKQKHEITAFGIGTNLVTCQSQPALGMVYKMVEINGKARIKISEDICKVTIPGQKKIFRIFTKDYDYPSADLMQLKDEVDPVVGNRYLCRHPLNESKRAYVTPTKVVPLSNMLWDGSKTKKILIDIPTLTQLRDRVREGMSHMREDHVRSLNPTPYKISLSSKLYDFMHDLWLVESPVPEI